MAEAGLVAREHAPGAASDVAEEAAPKGPIRVALVGVPNSGKSLTWRRLTGTFTDTANCPNTTCQVRTSRTLSLGSREGVLIDTPGLLGLEFASEDEEPTRRMLSTDPPDVIVQCVDASNLTRSLMLTAQLADLEIPMVVSLTMADEAMRRGLFVDAERLSEALGVPVTPVCALDGRGMGELRSSVDRSRRPKQVDYPETLSERFADRTREGRRPEALAWLMDEEKTDPSSGAEAWGVVLESHYHWARGVTEEVVRSSGLGPAPSAWSLVGKVAMHPVGGWLFLLLTFAAAYLLVAEVGVKILADGLDRLVLAPATAAVAGWVGGGLLGDILVGPYGLLSLGLFNAIGTVLPILAVFYLFFGLLEEVGYFPLLSAQMDRLLRLLGLNGRAVLSMTLGFGCNAVAAMTTRSLDHWRQRFIASFLIALGIPCAVQLGVLVAILATVPLAVMLATLAVIAGIRLVAGALLGRSLPDRRETPFLLELPPLRPPRWGNIAAKTYHRLKDFLLEATPLFVASAATLLVLHYTGLLDRIRSLLAPVVVTALGLPHQFAETLLVTLARREVGAVMFKEMVDAGSMDLRQIFVGLLVMTLFVPCLTTSLVMGRVLGARKSAIIFVAVIAIAIAVGAAANGAWGWAFGG